MLNKKPLLGLAALAIFASNSAVAITDENRPEIQPVSGDVTFSGSVEAQCGVYAIKDTADLGFGDEYKPSRASLKLINNSDEDVEIFATNIDLSSFEGAVEEQNVKVKSGGIVDEEKNLEEWGEGIEIESDDIKNGGYMTLAAKVDLDESQLDAGKNYEVRTTWTVECN